MKKLVCGILAHVDSGKTTLSEALLYAGGTIKKAGRVDKQDAFLDHYELERERGITIFSKQALIRTDGLQLTLVDTPGHVDFSAETERTLQILDAAILVVSAPDGVQGHTETLWRLLARYRIPTFLFINKTDLPGPARETLMTELTEKLSAGCLNFEKQGTDAFFEQAALFSEQTLEQYLESGTLTDGQISALIAERELFPCFFGSALKMDGVQELLDALARYAPEKSYGNEFAARVYKIGRDAQGNRLTYLKVTGGSLAVRDVVSYGEGERAHSEKVSQIRIYSGARYETPASAQAGEVCAVTGLSATAAGEGLGAEKASAQPFFVPVLTYRLILPDDIQAAQFLPKLRQLEEEEPQLHVCWEEHLKEIHVQLMGEVQTEILQRLIMERFGVAVRFDAGRIVYRETLAEAVEGVGHYEPLRHYAEVHLYMEPGEPGSGLVFASACSEEVLDGNWQRLVLKHLEEKEHVGVLTGAPITDMKITLVSGRAHLKHTEGGDFRQATYRAVRQGLRSARCVLLEPYYRFQITVPAQQIGRVMTDMEKRCAQFGVPEAAASGSPAASLGSMPASPGSTDASLGGAEPFGESMTLTGIVPVSEMSDYARELASYTKGRGRMNLSLHGYERCHHAQEIVAEIGYDPEADTENPTGSIFCGHGAGFYVPWNEVTGYMHVEALPARTGRMAEGGSGTADSVRESDFTVHGMTGRTADRISEAGIAERDADGMYASDFAKGSEERAIGTEEIDAIVRRSGGANRKEDNTERKVWSRRYDGGQWKNRARAGAAEDVQTDIAGKSGTEISNEEHGMGSIHGKPQYDRNGRHDADKEYLLVDGYNVIFAWEDFSALAAANVDAARGKLMDVLCNYQAMRGCEVIVVFDAYRVQGHAEELTDYHNIHVVFTKEAETADQYIEKFAHENGRKYRITVATSDGLEQIIIRGQGCALLSSRELREEIAYRSAQFREAHMTQTGRLKNTMEEKLKGMEILQSEEGKA
ncbi:MAG: TetM/TetW/TetO/TetS family tetracycline resistance ribosomal protection protein [bacterium]|nr:TetM/TetW/TetO/TetS family tetracycline resistance ribosomal protection protein [bacterium]